MAIVPFSQISCIQAVSLLQQGDVIAFPTETVYGLGVDARNDQAVRNLFLLKKRNEQNPMSVLLASPALIARYAHVPSDIDWMLIQEFMPGPLTLLLPKKSSISDLVTAGRPLVGIRIPALVSTLELLAGFDGPLVAPSANPSGLDAPVDAQGVGMYFGEKIPMILDGGRCTLGINSTVVEVRNSEVIIHRLGSLPQEMIQQTLQKKYPDVVVRLADETDDVPGRAYKPILP